MVRRGKLSPLNINLKAKELAITLVEILDLTQYEKDVMRIMLSIDRVIIGSELPNYGTIPRTKAYSILKSLEKRGLVESLTLSMDDIDKPDIYEYWPEKNRTSFQAQRFVGVHFYKINLEYIKDLYYTWSTEYFTRKQKISELLEILDSRKPLELEYEEDVLVVH